jgi:hypothetical protein
VKRWASAFAVVLFFCALVFASRSTDPNLLKDTDTATLLHVLQERDSPLGWFAGDWPLGNHFYRPISTLTFEADRAVYGGNAAGYGATNALLAVGCILALFWFLRELTDRPSFACAGAVVFALWHIRADWFYLWLSWAAIGVYLVPLGALLPGRRVLPNLLAMFVASLAVTEIYGANFGLGVAVIGWLPGRTASTMALFALMALAAYARFERRGSIRESAPPSSLDRPATKSTSATEPAGRANIGWALVACLFGALALGSYEQAVMLPTALFGVAVAFRMRGYRVRWGWQAAFWGLLLGYLALRYALVPADASGYQRQQFRSGPGVWIAVCDVTFPCLLGLWQLPDFREFGWVVLLWNQTYQTIWVTMSNVAGVVAARRRLPLILVGWVLSVLTFLPMAWLKPFGHYYYWPAAFRAILVAALFSVLAELVVSAWSRPARLGPPRLDPAPGSLPHP